MPWRLEMGLAGKSLAPVPSERSSPVGIAQTCRISVTANKPDSNKHLLLLPFNSGDYTHNTQAMLLVYVIITL